MVWNYRKPEVKPRALLVRSSQTVYYLVYFADLPPLNALGLGLGLTDGLDSLFLSLSLSVPKTVTDSQYPGRECI